MHYLPRGYRWLITVKLLGFILETISPYDGPVCFHAWCSLVSPTEADSSKDFIIGFGRHTASDGKNNKWHVNSKTIRPCRDSNVWGQSHWVNSAFPSLCFQYSQNDLKRQKAHQPAEDELINKGDLKVLFMAIINSFCWLEVHKSFK